MSTDKEVWEAVSDCVRSGETTGRELALTALVDRLTPPSTTVHVRRVSGLMYPANGAADALARIAGTWTLTEAQIRDARRLGIRVIEVGRQSKTSSEISALEIIRATRVGERRKE